MPSPQSIDKLINNNRGESSNYLIVLTLQIFSVMSQKYINSKKPDFQVILCKTLIGVFASYSTVQGLLPIPDNPRQAVLLRRADVALLLRVPAAQLRHLRLGPGLGGRVPPGRQQPCNGDLDESTEWQLTHRTEWGHSESHSNSIAEGKSHSLALTQTSNQPCECFLCSWSN